MTTFIELAVAAVISGTSVCSDHFPQMEQRINPTELDGYGQCVAIVNDIDHGTVGNNIWIRTGEGVDSVFTYVDTKDLANKSRGDAIEMITEEVIETMVDAEAGQELADLRAAQEALDLAGVNTDSVQDVIDSVTAAARARVMLVNAADVTVERGDNYDNSVTGFNPANHEVTLSQTLSGTTLSLIAGAVEAAYDAGYGRGYDSGYDAGYKDGYADGFADGVNSVR